MPKCCEGCHNLREGGSCTVYKHCMKWRIWYAVEWERIRIAAKVKRRGYYGSESVFDAAANTKKAD